MEKETVLKEMMSTKTGNVKNTGHISNMFKCLQHSFCIHVVSVCNSIYDCPLGDDELFCYMEDTSCPIECQCLAAVMRCSHIQNLTLSSTVPFSVIILRHTTIKNQIILSYIIQFTVSFTITDTKLIDVCPIVKKLTSLAILQAMHNAVQKIMSKCFVQNPSLQVVNLSANSISEIHWVSFSKLKLLLLDVSYNQLSNVDVKTYICTAFLSLSHNTKIQISPISFEKFNVSHLKTDKYEVCCFAARGTYLLCTDHIP